MITEFALTPWVFDQSTHQPTLEDWRFWLNTLANRLFPQPNLCPVLVTDFSGLWEIHAQVFVDGISDHRARHLAQKLLSQIKGRLVRRQFQPGATNLTSEAWWAQSGCSSSAVELIERLVATCGCHTNLTGTHAALKPLSDVDSDGFWQDVSVEWSPLATVPAQVATLRKLTVHGEFVWLATPYAAGTDRDETPFACEAIRETFRRPAGFRPPSEVELHTELPREAGVLVPVADHLAAVRRKILAALDPGQSVRHVVWKKLLERIALAGVFTTTSSGREHAPRWGVHMGHIARRHEARSGVSHEWKQLNDTRVGEWFRLFSTRSADKVVTTDLITA